MLNILKNFNKKEILAIFISFIFIVLQVFLELKIPDYMSNITTLVQTGSETSKILTQGIYMLICAFLSMICAIVVGYIIANSCSSFSKNIREKLFKKVSLLSMEEIKKFNTSSLITRTTNDVTNVESFLIMGLQTIIKAPVTAVWAIMKILGKNFTWTIITGGAVVILLIGVTLIMTTVLPRFKLIQKMIDGVNELTRENLKGIRVIRAFNAEKYQEKKFERQNEKLTNTLLFTQKVIALMSPMMYLIMNGVALSIYFFGAFIINNSAIELRIDLFSSMIIFTSYATQVIMSFLMFAFIFAMYPRAAISIDRINEVLNTKTKIKSGKLRKSKTNHEIEFINVSFKYPDSEEYTLKDISFKAQRGQMIAIIGSTGSGKSTLINLVPRFYDATEGVILVDGVNIKEYDLEYLYDKIGYVPQKAVMFNGSVNYNVSYGKKDNYNITEDTIKEAIKVAQAEDFVLKMDNTYESNIAEGGTNISGGQKQRIAIARAIARDPEIYIFDDSFSALDYKTDYILRSELKKYTKDAISLVVASRIGTIKNADKIIVLDNGKCVGMGTHKELLKNCEVYKEIAYSQLSKEELLNE